MIYISYYKLQQQLTPQSFNALLQTLPVFLQDKILNFRNWQDRERSLAGNILLMMGLQALGLTTVSLDNINYTKYQKPYLDNEVSFNISHSGGYIICAVSITNEVGIDVEEIRDVPMEDFTNLFAKVEWDKVIESENKLHAFYSLWTKKEAFLKVIGCGLSQPLNEVVIEKNTITWQGNQWWLNEIILDTRHICYLCTDNYSPLIKLQEIYF